MDLDKLRNNWNSIDIPSGATSERVRKLESKVRTTRVDTLRDKLFRITINLVIVSVFGLLTIVPFVSDTPIMAMTAGAYFVLLGILNFGRAMTIRQINMSRLTVRDALLAVYRVERQRIVCRAIGITCAVPLLIYMLLTFADIYGRWMLYGALIGVLAGACIGLAVNHRTTALLKDLKSQLYDTDSSNC